MGLAELAKARVYERRYRAAARALDQTAQVVRMSRLIEKARRLGAEGGVVVTGGSRFRNAQRVGLLASSMNPLTCAHSALAEAAKAEARLDMLGWVATSITIDKERVERAALVDRLVECQQYARAERDGLLLLNGGLYVEQARAAHALLRSSVDVVLIVGYDKIVQIFDPRYYTDRDAALRELFAEAEVAVAPRAGAGADELRALLDRPENRPYAEHVHFIQLESRYVADSSTEARALASRADQRERLRELLAPEGLALALEARPYEPRRDAGPADLGDAYTARQTLLAALVDGLGDASLRALASAPPLSHLVEWSAEGNARGAALRSWAMRKDRRLVGFWAALQAG
ncbi:MAG TPA: hypothetical protein VF812_02980 [Ktedonobacterales bacterium]